MLIAEIGCNHKGDFDLALQMISVAAQCGANVVKFQKRHPKSLPTDQYNAPHPNPIHSYGATYGEHREALEFTQEQHRQLIEKCVSCGVIYSVSVWDAISAKEIVSLKPSVIKIPSARNNDFTIIGWLATNFPGELHISTGMTTKAELEKLMSFLQDSNRLQDVVLYSCTSGYPVSFDDVCLLEIKHFVEKYGQSIKAIGFSGHHLGIAIDNAALALGAKYIERHFTLDRSWKGTDHAASLEPYQFRQLAYDLDSTNRSLTLKRQEILPIEEPQRAKLKLMSAIAGAGFVVQ